MATHFLLAVLVLLAVGCSSDSARLAARDDPAPPRPAFRDVTTIGPRFEPVTTTTSTTRLPVLATPPHTVPLASSSDAPIDLLIVAPEHVAGYDRDRFEHWSDADGDRCNTRCEVLEAERRPDVGWVSIYDGFVTNDPSQLEIDHVVALAEAWRSGAWAWDDARREAFANDLDEPDALVAVSSQSNQSKADKDPAEWRPPHPDSWCQWAKGWVRTKVKWGLSADQSEVDALRSILAAC